MTTIIHSPARKHPVRGFTLAEVLIGMTLSGFVMAGILTTFLFLGRSGANVANYAEMETEARRGLELFAEDTRQASELSWIDTAHVALVVNGAIISYGYDAGTGNFSRTQGGSTRVLIKQVAAFEFKGYMITGTEVDITDLSTAALRTNASRLTKQLQISLRATRSSRTVATATNSVLSARYILRNKRVAS